MPILPPPINLAPYDPVETILNFARVIANDAGISMAGNLLSDTQPYTMTLMNLAWRKLQNRLYNYNIESFPEEFIITGIPAQAAAAFADPAIQCYINYSNYFDGVTANGAITLPGDMEIPLQLWERKSGVDSSFLPMVQATDALPSSAKTSFLRVWEWRGDAIHFQGANQVLDIRIRYRKILVDQTEPTSLIPLIRCAVALAYIIVEIFATSRGSTVTPAFTAEKEDAIRQLVNQTTRKLQRANFRRQPYSRRYNRVSF